MSNLEKHHQRFEEIKRINEYEQEYWSARQLAKVLEYSEYRHFIPIVEKAKEACKNSGQLMENHFEDILEMVEIGSGAKREIDDIRLSRYACYLIVQNADPSKEIVALGQTYFAIQTRRQELADKEEFKKLKEDEKRLYLRNEMKEHNKQLVDAAYDAGVESSRSWISPYSRITATRGFMAGLMRKPSRRITMSEQKSGKQ
jgi:DNA-damage-inducible protein D